MRNTTRDFFVALVIGLGFALAGCGVQLPQAPPPVTAGIVTHTEIDLDTEFTDAQVNKCKKASEKNTTVCKNLRTRGNAPHFSDYEVTLADPTGRTTTWETDDEAAFNAAVVGQTWSSPMEANVDND